MAIKGLFTTFDHEPSLKEIEDLKRKCVFCKKNIIVFCGTPVVTWGGCCIGYKTPTTRCMLILKGHSWCYIRHMSKVGLIKLTPKIKKELGALYNE